jgi:hypothetical protein
MNESVVRTLDASRRVGWARFYEATDEVEKLREALQVLADAVIFHPRIHSQDPIVALAQEVQRL